MEFPPTHARLSDSAPRAAEFSRSTPAAHEKAGLEASNNEPTEDDQNADARRERPLR